MSAKTRAADLRNVTGIQMPIVQTELVINDIYASSTLGEVSNDQFSFNNLGLDVAEEAIYHYIDESSVDDTITVRHQYNGETIQIPSPLRSGKISMCHEIAITQKYSRAQAIKLGKMWDVNVAATENMIARDLTRRVERNAYRAIASGAALFNQGNSAGAIGGHGILLGDTVDTLRVIERNPDNVGDFNVSATEVVNRLSLVHGLSESSCPSNKLRVLASPMFLNKLRNEQAAAARGGSCCIEDKPEISGLLSDTWGFPVLETHNLPFFLKNDGTRIDYVMLVNPEMVAAPMSLDYLEWRTSGHDVYLEGLFRYNAQLMSHKGAVVAAVQYK